jgi:hypothetical protein
MASKSRKQYADPGHFITRGLDATNKTNRPIVTALFAEIENRKLVAEAFALEAEKVAQKEREAAEAHRVYLKQQAGPALFDALMALTKTASRANLLQHTGKPVPAEIWADMYQETSTAWTALQQAQEA